MSLPKRIGRFRVVGLLGQGAMGVVYRGRDETLERDVALKVMSASVLGDTDSRQRFLREARASARLQHPNIITIYELGEHDGQPFMALELLEGIDLQRAIEAGIRPDPRATLPVVLQALAGLGHAHEQGIVHRDVKPSNVFLPQGRPVKLMDFGVARLAGGLTTKGLVIGTPSYMSPEQVRGHAVDGRSDLFSAGLILFELVTGEKAFSGPSVVSVMYKIAHETPRLGQLPRGPGWDLVRRVLERSLAREPDARYAGASEMAKDLSQALRELGGSADWSGVDLGALTRFTPRPRQVQAGEPAQTGVAPPTAPAATPIPGAIVASGEVASQATEPDLSPLAPTGTDRLPAWAEGSAPAAARRGPVWLVGGAAAALLVATAVGVALWHRPPPPSPAPSASDSPVPAPRGSSSPAAPNALSLPGPAMSSSPTPTPSMPVTPPSADVPSPVAPSPAVVESPGPTPTPVAPPVAPTPDPSPEPSAAPPTPAATPTPTPVPSAEPDAPPPVPESPRLDHARQLLQQGRHAAALVEAKAILDRDPRNAQAQRIAEQAEAAIAVEASLKRAREALARGDKDAALDELKRGLSVWPNDGRLLDLWREATQ